MTREVRVAAGRLRIWLDGFASRHGEVSVVVEPDEVALTGADDAKAWLQVPFAPLAGRSLEDFVAHVARDRIVGVLLVRRGGHAAGVFRGAALVASKVGSSYVQGGTKAGGWSQQRFARRRANQASAAFASAADDAVPVLSAAAGLEALVVGGDRAAVRAVLADSRLVHLQSLVVEPWLAVPDPRLRVLAAAPEQFLTVRIRLDP